MPFYQRVTAVFFQKDFTRHRCFASRVILFQRFKKNLPRLKCSPLKTFFNANTDVEPPFTPLGVHNPPSSLRSTSTLPPGDHLTHPGGQLLSLLSVKLIIFESPDKERVISLKILTPCPVFIFCISRQ